MVQLDRFETIKKWVEILKRRGTVPGHVMDLTILVGNHLIIKKTLACFDVP